VSCAPVLTSPAPFGAFRHKPRRAESTLLYQTLQSDLEAFLDDLDRRGRALPWFVRRELYEFLECGIAAHGFVRVRCDDLAAHWVDGVLPDVPMRQWVLTLPISLRYRLAFDHELTSRVLGIFIRAVFAWQRLQARRMGLVCASINPGAITAIQRFGSALNLNPHFHSLLFDGARFIAQRNPMGW
jgi:hypothetical protein